MQHIYNDGGRSAAGYKGDAGDCVVRAVAIATEQDYEQVYQAVAEINALAKGRAGSCGHRSARNGVATGGARFKRYMAALGWVYVATMGIGTGCKVHLTDGELPAGRLIVQVSKHYTTVIDGVIHDTFDPQRVTSITENGVTRLAQRCVYGYWRKA